MIQSVRKFAAVFALVALLAPAAGAWCPPESARHCNMAAEMASHACCDVTILVQCECQQPDHDTAEPAQRLSNGTAPAYSAALTATPHVFVPPALDLRGRSFEPPPRATAERLSLLATLLV